VSNSMTFVNPILLFSFEISNVNQPLMGTSPLISGVMVTFNESCLVSAFCSENRRSSIVQGGGTFKTE
jgi:hypothetical protein